MRKKCVLRLSRSSRQNAQIIEKLCYEMPGLYITHTRTQFTGILKIHNIYAVNAVKNFNDFFFYFVFCFALCFLCLRWSYTLSSSSLKRCLSARGVFVRLFCYIRCCLPFEIILCVCRRRCTSIMNMHNGLLKTKVRCNN